MCNQIYMNMKKYKNHSFIATKRQQQKTRDKNMKIRLVIFVSTAAKQHHHF